MRNRLSAILGVLLLCLWVAGLGSPYARVWLTWLDGLGGVGAFILGAYLPVLSTRKSRISAPLFLASYLLGIGTIGVVTPGSVWQGWWTVGFGAVFFYLSIAAALEAVPAHTADQDQTRIKNAKFRKSA